MKICILDDSYEQSHSVLKAVDLPSDPRRYLAEHDCEQYFLHKATAVQQVIQLARRNFDVFINLCDGAWDEDRPGIEVVQALERLGLPFTGATSAFYEPTREKMKKICHYWGIPTPAYHFAYHLPAVEVAAQTLRYPMIVKHPNSYSSIGLTPASRVTTERELFDQARLMIENFGGALIEEFIEGREFTVLVAENPENSLDPLAYLPVEFRFPPGESFKHFGIKWEEYAEMQCLPCHEPALAERLQTIAKQLFVGLEGASYGRCDIRMNAQGDLFMLEINPNCGIFYPPDAPGSADLILQYDPRGHKHFVDTILTAALKRRDKAQKKWQLSLNRQQNYGMYAVECIPAGALIERYEEQPHVLVSKSYAMQHWNSQQKQWFHQYAYPITDEIYVMWSHDPEQWKPLNHSCDPNAWLQGLDLVARRAIASGEQITIDYATFCNETMAEFACTCGATNCRGVIRGDDYRQAFIEQYGDHVSDYVRGKRL
jgi:D-alanine-D-alanine ligase-like ATP-grasp enzyme